MASSLCTTGPSTALTKPLLHRRTFYAGKAPFKIRSPVVRPPNKTDPPVNLKAIEASFAPTYKLPRNLKYPVTSDTWLPDRLVDPELSNRAAIPSPFRRQQWLENDEEGTGGLQFKRPTGMGPFYLDGEKPFPLNPSFKPPPPHSDTLRETIYADYLAHFSTEPEVAEPCVRVCRTAHDQPRLTARDELILRQLERKYHLPLDRLRAMIRLKALEKKREEVEGKQPQRHFQREMERFLGVRQGDLNAGRKKDEETYEAKEHGGLMRLTEMLNIEMGEKPLLPVLTPTPRLNRGLGDEVPKEALVPLRKPGRVLAVVDTTDTKRGRTWERTNTTPRSTSGYARRARQLEHLQRLGRLPKELYGLKEAEGMYKPPMEAPAQYFA